jgi:hypothetical protein
MNHRGPWSSNVPRISGSINAICLHSQPAHFSGPKPPVAKRMNATCCFCLIVVMMFFNVTKFRNIIRTSSFSTVLFTINSRFSSVLLTCSFVFSHSPQYIVTNRAWLEPNCCSLLILAAKVQNSRGTKSTHHLPFLCLGRMMRCASKYFIFQIRSEAQAHLVL